MGHGISRTPKWKEFRKPGAVEKGKQKNKIPEGK